jgi:hypothetical protein
MVPAKRWVLPRPPCRAQVLFCGFWRNVADFFTLHHSWFRGSLIARRITIAALGKGLGVSARSAAQYAAAGCPRTSIAAARKWKQEHVLPRKGGPGGRSLFAGEAEQHQSALHRRVLAEALKAEEAARGAKLKNDKAAGLLWEADQIVREFSELLSYFRAVLDAFPDSAASEFPESERPRIFDLAKHSKERALALLAGWKPSVANDAGKDKGKGRA